VIKVKPLVGHKALIAYNGFSSLMLGLMQTPLNRERTFDEFFEELKRRSLDDLEKACFQAVSIVNIEADELEAMASFCVDPNGVEYGKANIKNLGVKDLQKIIVAVCMEMFKIEINILSESEKKNSDHSASTLDQCTPSTQC
jgi:hypothetical protein